MEIILEDVLKVRNFEYCRLRPYTREMYHNMTVMTHVQFVQVSCCVLTANRTITCIYCPATASCFVYNC